MSTAGAKYGNYEVIRKRYIINVFWIFNFYLYPQIVTSKFS